MLYIVEFTNIYKFEINLYIFFEKSSDTFFYI